MSFKIWAVGLTSVGSKTPRKKFHYVKENCLDQSDFEPPALLAMIPDSPNVAGVAKKVVGTAEGHVGAAETKGVFKIAEMIFAHQVVSGVNFLAMHGGGRGSISVYCHQMKWYWADANSFADYRITRSGNPGKEFLKKIAPAEEDGAQQLRSPGASLDGAERVRSRPAADGPAPSPDRAAPLAEWNRSSSVIAPGTAAATVVTRSPYGKRA